MNPTIGQPGTTQTGKRVQRIGCVGYLNAKPLIAGLDSLPPTPIPGAKLYLDVPSALLGDLERGEVDIALCPVIDYYRSDEPLVIVPAGCIASDGPTETVRLFSRVPIDVISTVHVDQDSHTSITLMRVLLRRLHGLDPELIRFDARESLADTELSPAPQTMLLIGDKVVHDAPFATEYPYQMDLGESWKALTGLPFVFAIWMARLNDDLGDLPGLLDRQRERNAESIDEIACSYAETHGWERQAAQRYLEHVLSYRVGPEQIEAIKRFAQEAAQLGLIKEVRPLRLYSQEA